MRGDNFLSNFLSWEQQQLPSPVTKAGQAATHLGWDGRYGLREATLRERTDPLMGWKDPLPAIALNSRPKRVVCSVPWKVHVE